MTHKNTQNNQPKDDNLVDVTFNVKAKVSPKLKELIATTTEAGKTVVKVGHKLLPILVLLSAIATSCAPTNPELNSHPAPQIKSTQNFQQ